MGRMTLNNASFAGGLVALAFGGFVLEESAGYPRGTVVRMGPGFFPTLLGWLLLAFGVILLLGGLRRALPVARPEARALVLVLSGLGAFALTLPRYGLAPAIVLLVLVSALASPSSRPLPTLALALGLTGFAWALFVVALSLPLPMLVW